MDRSGNLSVWGAFSFKIFQLEHIEHEHEKEENFKPSQVIFYTGGFFRPLS